jgi:CheY-like chemotaxis protein
MHVGGCRREETGVAQRLRELWDDVRRGRRATAEDVAAEVATVRRVQDRYKAGARLSFGAPTRCPECGDFGLVEQVDVRAGRAANRCPRCGTTWTITMRALLAVERDDSASGRRAAFGAHLAADVAESRARRRQQLELDLSRSGDLGGVRFRRTPGGMVTRENVTLSLRRADAADDEDPGAEPEARATAPPVPVPAAGRMGPLRVLLVEDDPDDVALVRTLLEPAGPGVIDLRTAESRAAGEAEARADVPDLVLLDLGLPDSRGVATLNSWRAHVRGTPVLVISGDAGLEVLRQGRELGVIGVLGKAQLADMLARGDEGTADFVELLGASSDSLAPHPAGH